MSAPVYNYPTTGSAIAVDSDPNTAAPTELRTFDGPTGIEKRSSAAYVVPVGGAPTIQLWGYVTQLKRWAKIGAATACPVDTFTSLGSPPTGVARLFAQVTANSGATGFVVGFQENR